MPLSKTSATQTAYEALISRLADEGFTKENYPERLTDADLALLLRHYGVTCAMDALAEQCDSFVEEMAAELESQADAGRRALSVGVRLLFTLKSYYFQLLDADVRAECANREEWADFESERRRDEPARLFGVASEFEWG